MVARNRTTIPHSRAVVRLSCQPMDANATASTSHAIVMDEPSSQSGMAIVTIAAAWISADHINARDTVMIATMPAIAAMIVATIAMLVCGWLLSTRQNAPKVTAVLIAEKNDNAASGAGTRTGPNGATVGTP